jgi:hypothetical protein
VTRSGFASLGLGLAGVHFFLSWGIVPLTLAAGRTLPDGMLKSLFIGGLVAITKALYFPILALALYPRIWFPGHWIYVPVAVNSLLWGLVLAVAVVGLRRLRPARS